MTELDGILFARMINSGAANLKAHAKEINDLNVFPIPDGDTGDNMMMTITGGVHHDIRNCESLCEMADRVSSGMLLSARGNSGVILSQFFEGIKKTEEQMEKLLPYCNALDFEPYRDKKMSMSDEGYIGY